MKFERVEFLKPVPIPGERNATDRPDGLAAAEGYALTRNGGDLVIYHERFGARVVVVPFTNCLAAWASEEELTAPETVTRKEGKRQ